MVIDTLGTMVPRVANAENDPATMKSVMEPYIGLCNNEKTSVIFLHHTNAEGGVRGTTSIQYDVQWVFKMQPLGLDEHGHKRVQCSQSWKYEPVPDFLPKSVAERRGHGGRRAHLPAA